MATSKPSPGRFHGFMAQARKVLKREYPRELTANEVVDEVEKMSGTLPSVAQNPRMSLVATLSKHYHQHGLKRQRGASGRYMYSSQSPGQPAKPISLDPQAVQPSGSCCVTLPDDDVKRIKALVALGKYKDEHEAHLDLVKRGLRGLDEDISRL